ncbi:hypothetical protein U1Q18_016768 [Sarracenia purpurea var. burkii]
MLCLFSPVSAKVPTILGLVVPWGVEVMVSPFSERGHMYAWYGVGLIVAATGLGSGCCCWFLAASGLVHLVLASFCYWRGTWCWQAVAAVVKWLCHGSLYRSLRFCCSARCSCAFGGHVLAMEFGCFYSIEFLLRNWEFCCYGMELV